MSMSHLGPGIETAEEETMRLGVVGIQVVDLPVIPGMHMQVYEATRSMQVDPLKHGLLAHSSISRLQSLPL